MAFTKNVSHTKIVSFKIAHMNWYVHPHTYILVFMDVHMYKHSKLQAKQMLLLDWSNESFHYLYYTPVT